MGHRRKKELKKKRKEGGNRRREVTAMYRLPQGILNTLAGNYVQDRVKKKRGG